MASLGLVSCTQCHNASFAIIRFLVEQRAPHAAEILRSVLMTIAALFLSLCGPAQVLWALSCNFLPA